MAKAKSRTPKRAPAARAKRAKATRATPARAAKKARAATKATRPKKKAAKASAARPKRAKRVVPSAKPVAKHARKTAVPPPAAKAKAAKSAKAARTSPSNRSGRAPTLDRERRRATEPEMVPSPPSSLDMDRSASAARSGRAELAHKIHEHTSTGPALTAGDVDADWESADSVGDEAPGGDNPTPDQDVVDEIGRSLGVEYDDDEELQGGDEIGERDRKRWELDPASADDFDEREK